MTKKENAHWQAGAKRNGCEPISSKVRALIKSAALTAILWRLVPLSVGDALVRVLRLGDAP